MSDFFRRIRQPNWKFAGVILVVRFRRPNWDGDDEDPDDPDEADPEAGKRFVRQAGAAVVGTIIDNGCSMLWYDLRKAESLRVASRTASRVIVANPEVADVSCEAHQASRMMRTSMSESGQDPTPPRSWTYLHKV